MAEGCRFHEGFDSPPRKWHTAVCRVRLGQGEAGWDSVPCAGDRVRCTVTLRPLLRHQTRHSLPLNPKAGAKVLIGVGLISDKQHRLGVIDSLHRV